MEAKIRHGKAQLFYGSKNPEAEDDRKTSEWDLNDWKWDGDLFRASRLDSAQLDGSSRQFLPEGSHNPACTSGCVKGASTSIADPCPTYGNRNGNRESEKRRRGALVEDEQLGVGAGLLSLKLGGQVYPISDDDLKGGKKTKCVGPTTSGVVCQVEGCKTDLSGCKDYHRRHKVCEMHAKAGEVLVGKVVQRFCQQCSRFHVLQEFDEGKRSCRRRLAGHNRRRRKTHPDPVASGVPLNGERDNNYVLISLLRILSNMQPSCLAQTKDQDLLTHLLKNLAGSGNMQNISGLLQEAKIAIPSDGPESAKAGGSNFQEPARPIELNIRQPDVVHNTGTNARGIDLGNSSSLKSMVQFPSKDVRLAQCDGTEATVGRIRLNNFDLNNVYDEEKVENSDKDPAPLNQGEEPLSVPKIEGKYFHRVSPAPNTSASNSTSSQSPSSSSAEAQSRTDRIVFKLFGKDPNDLPHDLRKQILDWLSQSPTDIESYLRPGCIILTVYFRLENSMWDELCRDLGSNLRRLFEASNDSFWRTGWIFTRVQASVAFAYNGRVLLDTPISPRNEESYRIAIVKPVAVSVSDSAQFSVKGFNLLRSTSRLLCSLQGKYLTQRSCYDLVEGDRTVEEPNELQCLNFRCSIPQVCGRGFIEVEDCSLRGNFFPFIVAEEEVCAEIRMLENAIDTVTTDHARTEARNQALDFIHEMGWLLHRNHLKLRVKATDHYDSNLFSLKRFEWLIEFAVEKGWCAVVKKLLDILFNGVVGPVEDGPVSEVLLNMGLLHKAVQRNCREMVEFLLSYVPGCETKSKDEFVETCYIFRPDDAGPGGLTPLHVAASSAGFELVLDALTNDPASVGLEAWNTVCDDIGRTPNDYASVRRHYSYIHLVDSKINGKSDPGHSVVDIPISLPEACSSSSNAKTFSIDIEKEKRPGSQALQKDCILCERRRNRRVPYRTPGRASLLYHPMTFLVVAVAAVCVCVALLFKSSPEVLYGFRPFRWEDLEYGSS